MTLQMLVMHADTIQFIFTALVMLIYGRVQTMVLGLVIFMDIMATHLK